MSRELLVVSDINEVWLSSGKPNHKFPESLSSLSARVVRALQPGWLTSIVANFEIEDKMEEDNG